MASERVNPERYSDDEFVRPRKKSGNGPILVLIGLGVLLIGGLIFALIYFFAGKNNLDSEMLAYVPADSNILMGVEVEALLKNDKIKSLLSTAMGKTFLAKLNEAGLSENDFSRILLGGNSNVKSAGNFGGLHDGSKDANAAIVIRTKKSFDKPKLIQATNLKEITKNGKTCYEGENAEKVFFPSDTLIVLALSEKTLDEITRRDGGKAAVSDDMQELGTKMSKGHLWFAFGKSFFGDELKSVEKAGAGDAPADFIDAVKGMRALGAYLKIDGDTVSFGGGILCADSTAAAKGADALQKKIDELSKKDFQKEMGLQPEVSAFISDLQKSSKSDSSGALLEVSSQFSATNLENIFKSSGIAKMFPQQGPIRVGEMKDDTSIRPKLVPKITKNPPVKKDSKTPE